MTNLHPLWFAIFPFLFIVEHNSSKLTSEDLKTVFAALTVTVLLTGLLWFFLNRIVKNTSKSALIVSLFLVLFFSYGHFINLIENYWPDFIIATDINLNFGESAEITNVILSTTLLYPILSKLNIGLGDWKTKHFKRENMRFQALRQIPEYRKATFTFAHMYITHDPYAFDENCEYVAEHEEKMLPIDDAYIAAIKCANKKIINTVEAILSQYNKNELPIIIIQGDEGPFPKRYRRNQMSFDWKKEATEMELKKKFSILNAYYLPGAKTNLLYPSISPVNSFRVVFNLFFNEEYDLLPDKSYAFKDDENIYDFFDVTDIVGYR